MSVPYISDNQNTGSLVTTGLLTAWSHANSAYQLASGAIKVIQDFVPKINVSANITVQPTTGPHLGSISGSRPTKPGDLSPHYPQSPDAPIFTTINYGEIPGFPDLVLEDMAIPEVVINTNLEKYDSELLKILKAKMSDRILNGGTGLSPQVETAIFNRDQERALLALDEAKTRAADDWAKRGFTLPNGILLEAISNLEVEFINKRLETSKDISIKQADLEQTNVNTTIQQAVNLEAALMADQRQFSELLLRAGEALQKAKIDIYTVWTAFYKTYVESIKNYSEALSEKARTEVEMNKDLLGRYSADLEKFKTLVQAEVDRINVLLKTYAEDISAYESEAKAYQAIASVEVEELRARIQESLGTANIAVEAARANIQTAIEGAKVQVEALIAAGHTAAQLAAGAMAGGHVGATISSGFSQGNSASNSETITVKGQ